MKLRRILYILCLLMLLVAPAMAADVYMGFITHRDANTVTVFDPNTNAVVTSFSTDAQPRGVYVNPAGTYIYVPCAATYYVDIYRTTDYTQTGRITLPTAPYGICGNADGSLLYVTSTADTSFYVIDATTNTISATVTATYDNMRYCAYYDSKVYVTFTSDNKVGVFNTASNTFTSYINVGVNPNGITANTVEGLIYVTNSGADTVSVIDPATGTVTATIAGLDYPYTPATGVGGTYVYIPNLHADTVSVVTAATGTITGTANVGDQPRAVYCEPNGAYYYVTNLGNTNVSVVDTTSNAVVRSINLSYATPDYIIIAKINPGNTAAPMQATFTIMSGVLVVTNANVSIYDADTGVLMDSDDTDDAGNVIFWVVPGHRYTVKVAGPDITATNQSVQVQPSKDLYTINVKTNTQWWNPFTWFTTNGSSTIGSPDAIKSITSGYHAKLDGTTGYIEVYYNDTTGGTSAINFELYYRNTTSAAYEYVTHSIVSANNGSYNFTILNADNKTYRFYANGTNTYFGVVSRVGEHWFPNLPLNLGWPAQYYGYFEMMIFLCIGYMSTRRRAVMLAGATFLLFISWVFLIVGWMAQLSLWVPILIGVLAIMIFAYAVARWRMESGI